MKQIGKWAIVGLSLAWLAGAPAGAQEAPAGYPADYGKIIEASKAEDGLLVYSTTASALWAPFVDLAKQRYPWLKVETTDDSQLWEKYYAESVSGVRTADIVMASHPDQWLQFVERGQVDPYVSAEGAKLPDWSKSAPGVYTASADPMIMAYNRAYFEGQEPPMSVAQTVAALKARPELANKITLMDPDGNPMGLAVWTAWTQKVQDGWSMLDLLGPSIRPERSAGTVREKVLTGEYAIAVFTSGGGIPRWEEPANKALTGWGFPKDGTPMVTRNVAITKAAKSPNSARLFLDLLLTREGQIALSQGGMMPYRDDVAPADVKYGTFKSVADAVGADNIIFIAPDKDALNDTNAVLERWRKALGR